LTVRDAADYALQALDGGAPDADGAVARTLARTFADRRPIGASLLDDGPLDPERLIADFKSWFGHEVAALAGRTGRAEGDLARISDRTLRKWRRNDHASDAE
ncbi:MAG TPA: hypothetical protein PKA64_20160, partial [Myxococcota bacterium]|nr:hypothetical protein [Myxococcota bacterium]